MEVAPSWSALPHLSQLACIRQSGNNGAGHSQRRALRAVSKGSGPLANRWQILGDGLNANAKQID